MNIISMSLYFKILKLNQIVSVQKIKKAIYLYNRKHLLNITCNFKKNDLDKPYKIIRTKESGLRVGTD